MPDDVKAKLNKGEKVEVTICSKAINFDFNIQPETMDPYWNARGVCINNWYRVKVVLDPNLAEVRRRYAEWFEIMLDIIVIFVCME